MTNTLTFYRRNDLIDMMMDALKGKLEAENSDESAKCPSFVEKVFLQCFFNK